MSDYFEEPRIGGVVASSKWYVERHGEIREVEQGDKIRFRVQIWDSGREPFVTQWFNDITPARGFLEKLQEDNESHHKIRR